MRTAAVLCLAVLAAAAGDLPEGAVRGFGSGSGAHPAAVADAEFSPDGTLVVSVDEDGGLRIWDYPALRLRVSRELGEEGLWVAVNPAGTLVAVGRLNGVHLYTLPEGRPAGRMFGPPPGLVAGAFSRDGRRFAAADEECGLHVWDVEKRSYEAGVDLSQGGEIERVLWSAEGVVAQDSDGSLGVFSGEDLSEVRRIETGIGFVSGCALSPDGKRLAVAEDAAGVRVWDLATGQEGEALAPEGMDIAEGLVWSRDGARLAWSSYDNEACVWAIREGSLESRSPMDRACPPRFSTDGATLLCGVGGHRLFSTKTDGSGRAGDVSGHSGPVRSLIFEENGRSLLSGGEDGEVWAWELGTGPSRRLFRSGPAVWGLGRVAGQNRVLLCSTAGGVAAWNVSRGTREFLSAERLGYLADTAWAPEAGLLFIMGQNGHCESWRAGLAEPVMQLDVAVKGAGRVAVRRDGSLLALSCGGTVMLYDARSQRVLASVAAQHHEITAMALSGDGAWLACAGQDGLLALVELASGSAVPSGIVLPDIQRIAFAGSRLVVMTDDSLHVIPLATLAEDPSPLHLPSFPTALAVSGEAGLVATGQSDGLILVWPVPEDAAAAANAPPEALVKSLEGDPDDAREAIFACRGSGPATVAALEELLRSLPPVPQGTDALVASLEAEEPADREAAQEALLESGPGTEPALRTALPSATAEARGRIEVLLAWFELTPTRSPAVLRRLRAICALEACGSAEAANVLRRLASKSPYERERRDAEAALRRMEGK
ncbi:MAG: WD40 repeat domain-containing protein [Planctomycetia bacterium]|nr:WD40 repeat domain-containing protein [Planctomycetia bacterium]